MDDVVKTESISTNRNKVGSGPFDILRLKNMFNRLNSKFVSRYDSN